MEHYFGGVQGSFQLGREWVVLLFLFTILLSLIRRFDEVTGFVGILRISLVLLVLWLSVVWV